MPYWVLRRDRIAWGIWDYSLLVFPFIVWIQLLAISSTPIDSDLSLITIVFGALVPIGPIIRVLRESRQEGQLLAFKILLSYCIVPVVLVLLQPSSV